MLQQIRFSFDDPSISFICFSRPVFLLPYPSQDFVDAYGFADGSDLIIVTKEHFLNMTNQEVKEYVEQFAYTLH